MEKGNLAKWLKKEGDKVKAGDVLGYRGIEHLELAWRQIRGRSRILVAARPKGHLCIIQSDKWGLPYHRRAWAIVLSVPHIATDEARRSFGGVPPEPMNILDQVFDDRQVVHRGINAILRVRRLRRTIPRRVHGQKVIRQSRGLHPTRRPKALIDGRRARNARLVPP